MSLLPLVQFKYGGEDLQVQRDIFVSLYFEESLYGGTVYSLEVKSRDEQKWNRLINKEGSREGALRLGYSADGQNKWTKATAIRCGQPVFKCVAPQAIGVTLAGTDLGTDKLSACGHYAYVKKTVAEIMKEVAERRGLVPKIKSTEGSISVYQSGMKDSFFLWDYVLPYAKTNDGRFDFYCYVNKGKELVLKVPDYKQTAKRTYTLGLEKGGSFVSIDTRISYRSDQMDKAKSEFSRVVGYDMLKKELAQFDINDKTINLPQPGGATVEPDPGNEPTRIVLSSMPTPGARDRTRVKDYGSAHWSRRANSLYRVALQVFPTIEIELGDIITLKLLDSKGKNHFYGGNYLVYGITHMIIGERWSSTLLLERRHHG